MSLHDKVLPPSLNFRDPNPNVDWATSPFRVNTELRDWPEPPSGVRRGGVSAFGFGGTNFHAVLEEYVPGRFDTATARQAEAAELRATSGQAQQRRGPGTQDGAAPAARADRPAKVPLRGALVLGAESEADLAARLGQVHDQAAAGQAPPPQPPDPAALRASYRVAIDYGSAAELADKTAMAVKALTGGTAEMRKMLRARGIFLRPRARAQGRFPVHRPGLAVRQHAR